MSKGLGQKLNRGTRKLGNKIDKKAHQLGHKSNDVLNKAQGVRTKILQSTKGINAITTGLRTADDVMDVVGGMGADTIPQYAAVHGAVKGARVGAETLKEARTQFRNQSKEAIDTGRKHATDLEKFNIRKKLSQTVEGSANDGFA
jgi:hypothetical protein